MLDIEKILGWLEGLAEDDWHLFYSNSEVSEIAKAAFALLKEQEAEIRQLRLALDIAKGTCKGIIFK